MFHLSGIFFLVVAVACASLLFRTSQSVQRAEKNLRMVSQDKYSEEESLRVLTAEWDYLNRPERLEKLTLENLDMDEAHAQDVNFVAAVNEIPEPYIPALPKQKPKDLLRYVSLKKVEKVQKKAPLVIERAEQDKFSELLNDISKEGKE